VILFFPPHAVWSFAYLSCVLVVRIDPLPFDAAGVVIYCTRCGTPTPCGSTDRRLPSSDVNVAIVDRTPAAAAAAADVVVAIGYRCRITCPHSIFLRPSIHCRNVAFSDVHEVVACAETDASATSAVALPTKLFQMHETRQ